MIIALSLAAKRGVDVRLMTPGIPDKKRVYAITRSHYHTLVKAGIRIYEYTPGFMHAKSFVSDDDIACVGTINIDYRSLFLHFECGTLLVNSSTIKDIKDDFICMTDISREITSKAGNLKFLETLYAAILRVFSPIL